MSIPHAPSSTLIPSAFLLTCYSEQEVLACSDATPPPDAHVFAGSDLDAEANRDREMDSWCSPGTRPRDRGGEGDGGGAPGGTTGSGGIPMGGSDGWSLPGNSSMRSNMPLSSSGRRAGNRIPPRYAGAGPAPSSPPGRPRQLGADLPACRILTGEKLGSFPSSPGGGDGRRPGEVEAASKAEAPGSARGHSPDPGGPAAAAAPTAAAGRAAGRRGRIQDSRPPPTRSPGPEFQPRALPPTGGPRLGEVASGSAGDPAVGREGRRCWWWPSTGP